MSTLTDALHVFVQCSIQYAEAPAGNDEHLAQQLARAGDAYESALAQFTADVARHAVT